MRNFFVFLLAVLLGGGLFLGVIRARRQATPVRLEEPAVAERTEATERKTPMPAPEPAVKAPEIADEIPPPALPGELAGSIVVQDEHGVKLARESGFLALGLGNPGARTLHELEVREGRWRLALPPDTGPDVTLELRACVLDGKETVLAPGQGAELALPVDGRVDVRVRWSAGALLHVRARDTGAQLAEVMLYELLPALRGSALDAPHPGLVANARSRAARASPVRIQPDAGVALDARVLFAKAPGYAWGRIEVSPMVAQDLTLALDPAGALELDVVCDPKDTELELLLLEAAPPHAEVLVLQRGEQRSFLIEDLRAGSYLVQARHSGLLVGSVEVALAAGQRAKAVLTVATPPSSKVPFEGVLVVPEAWALEDFILEFLLQGRFDGSSLTAGSFEIRRSEMTLEPGSNERYRWRAPSAQPARYRVLLHPTPFVTEIDTGPAGTTDALVDVPPPASVKVRWFDEASGTEVVGEKASFAALTPRALVMNPLANHGSFELRVPQGRILLSSRPARYEPSARVLEVGPGTNDVLLPARKRP